MSESGTRKHLRVELADAAVRCEVWESGTDLGRPFDGVITVLGLGGAFIEMRQAFEVGTRIGLCFGLADGGNEVLCGGIVRDHKPAQDIGIEFASMMSTDRERIQLAIIRAASGRELVSASRPAV